MIREVVLQDNAITILGMEEYPQKNYDAKMLTGGKPFSRIIDPSFILGDS
jgi:hypothetical protein